jgi:AcrR family transcriptional regulator
MSLDPDKRDRILDAATELFAKFGFKKTSIDEIAAAANVGKGTIYLMAKNKEDLFYQVVHREIRQWCADIAEHIDPRLPADQLLVTCNLVSMQYLEKRPLVRDLLLGNHEEVLPMWVDQLEDLRGVARQRHVEILQIGIKQGLFREDLDLPTIGKLLQDLHAMGLLIAYRERTPPAEQMRYAAVAVDVLLNGLKRK